MPIYDLEGVSHTELLNRRGVRYLEFRKSLRPRYWKVALDIFEGYLGIFLVLFFLIKVESLSLPFLVPSLLLGSFAIGYLMAYLQLFIHEGAHYNIAKARPVNDLLTNLFISSWVGQSVQFYRQIHWEHHRNLGQLNDSEHSYFQPLNGRTLLKALFFFYFIEILTSRKNRVASMDPSAQPKESGRRLFLLLGILLNAGFLFLLVRQGHLLTAIAWVAGMASFFPLFAVLRPLLEHRSNQARATVDYQKTVHGRFSRMFREGPIGSSMGAAGFSRHLLHHWDPQVSYTCLAQMEAFLMETEFAERLIESKTSYWRVFRELWAMESKSFKSPTAPGS